MLTYSVLIAVAESYYRTWIARRSNKSTVNRPAHHSAETRTLQPSRGDWKRETWHRETCFIERV